MPFATTVVSRTRQMIMSGFLREPPLWFPVVNAYPPISTQPITHVKRSGGDLPASLNQRRIDARAFKNKSEGIKPIVYPEADKLRDRFFRDHPWEAVKPTTFIEGPQTADDYTTQWLSGKRWIELREKTLNPTPDDCIDFALNLHKAHELDLETAYTQAVEQFRSLRARHEIETRFALLEARANGAFYGPGLIGEGVKVEDDVMSKWSRASVVEGAFKDSENPVIVREEEEGDGQETLLRERYTALQYTQPITDGTVNAAGHARREPHPQFTGGLAYLGQRHKLDGGNVVSTSSRPQAFRMHNRSPVRTVFKDFVRTRLEQRGGPTKTHAPYSRRVRLERSRK